MKNNLLKLLSLMFVFVIVESTSAQLLEEETKYTIVLKDDVKWEHLNPARGDKAPQAGTLWGDRNAAEATGFLLKPKDGFESPPHIHNVSYRGIVINGLIHNDDPNADNMWMPAGSFWTQPKGAVHITAAKGSNTLAYIEIDNGPYHVMPIEKEFDSGEEPINMDESNMVWLEASDIRWVEEKLNSDVIDNPRLAFLWGTPGKDQPFGALIMLPKGFNGKIKSYGDSFKAVVIKGQSTYEVLDFVEVTKLKPGSYFSSIGKGIHLISTSNEMSSILYVRTNGKFEILH